MSSPWQDPMIDKLCRVLDINVFRSGLIVSNMANVDTPGYHTKDVDFKSAMRQAMNEGGDAQMQPASIELQGLPERPDGNDVNIDRESLVLSQTQLQYQMGVQLIKEEFHRLLTAIKDGN